MNKINKQINEKADEIKRKISKNKNGSFWHQQ